MSPGGYGGYGAGYGGHGYGGGYGGGYGSGYGGGSYGMNPYQSAQMQRANMQRAYAAQRQQAHMYRAQQENVRRAQNQYARQQQAYSEQADRARAQQERYMRRAQAAHAEQGERNRESTQNAWMHHRQPRGRVDPESLQGKCRVLSSFEYKSVADHHSIRSRRAEIQTVRQRQGQLGRRPRRPPVPSRAHERRPGQP